jgi:hypothetical protein
VSERAHQRKKKKKGIVNGGKNYSKVGNDSERIKSFGNVELVKKRMREKK